VTFINLILEKIEKPKSLKQSDLLSNLILVLAQPNININLTQLNSSWECLHNALDHPTVYCTILHHIATVYCTILHHIATVYCTILHNIAIVYCTILHHIAAVYFTETLPS
jgi:hypothetical protein